MNTQSVFKLLVVVFLFSNCNNQEPNQAVEEEVKPIVKEGVLEVDGFKLQYIRRGTGMPVFVVGSSHYYSKAFSKELEKKL